mmetsp:Transcript_93907/g.260912  ORF Transcript_93907/g.260912 Transcript_93907/m.260912 type:complete len:252 (+) Transcript_93907:82-837(+)
MMCAPGSRRRGAPPPPPLGATRPILRARGARARAHRAPSQLVAQNPPGEHRGLRDVEVAIAVGVRLGEVVGDRADERRLPAARLRTWRVCALSVRLAWLLLAAPRRPQLVLRMDHLEGRRDLALVDPAVAVLVEGIEHHARQHLVAENARGEVGVAEQGDEMALLDIEDAVPVDVRLLEIRLEPALDVGVLGEAGRAPVPRRRHHGRQVLPRVERPVAVAVVLRERCGRKLLPELVALPRRGAFGRHRITG